MSDCVEGNTENELTRKCSFICSYTRLENVVVSHDQQFIKDIAKCLQKSCKKHRKPLKVPNQLNPISNKIYFYLFNNCLNFQLI